MPPTEDEWLTAAQAAERLGLTVDSVRRRVHEGKIAATKFGNRVHLIRPEEVERYRREHLGQGAWRTRKKKPADAPAEENER